MLAEKIPNKSAFGRKGFQLPVFYVARDDADGQGKPKPALMGVVNLDTDVETEEDRSIVAEIMNTTAQRAARLKANPISHWVLSWRGGEHPNQKQIQEAVRHAMDTMGMGECQAFWAFHQDTDNDHVHLVINRALPNGRVIKEPIRDYLLMDRSMREREIQQGWSHDHGPWMVREEPGGQKAIVRMSREERAALGLIRDVSLARQSVSPSARQGGHNAAAPSFQEWVGKDPAMALSATLKAPGASWQDVHRTLAGYGLTLQPKHHGEQSGLVVTSPLGERILSAKASLLGRWASRQRLEERLGPFVPDSGVIKGVRAKDTYGDFLERFQRGDGGSWEKGKSGGNDRRPGRGDGRDGGRRRREDPDYQARREARRAERAEARADLYQRYRDEQERLKRARREARKGLQERHRQERALLQIQLREARTRAVAGLRGVEARLALAEYAFHAAREREVLQKRQAGERQALFRDPVDPSRRAIPKGEVWRRWLEQQAEHGDEAAQSALRGIRYQEQRQAKQHQNGIEGEEMGPFRPVLSALRPDVDPLARRITYRDADGKAIFTDTGPRIDVHDHAGDSLEAALRVAAQRYGGKVDITGSSEFREQAARMAVHLGIEVLDEDLQTIGQENLENSRHGSAWAAEEQQERTRQDHTEPSLEKERGFDQGLTGNDDQPDQELKHHNGREESPQPEWSNENQDLDPER